jgi:GTP diphosphokinase / guanosine-3',5'-bis(diphosphate) 3'-diphosphatase
MVADLEALLALHGRSRPEARSEQLRQAFDTAANLSGDPYLTRPLAVAGRLAELGMDTTTLVAALLLGTVGNTAHTIDQLQVDFGDEVATLVRGVIEGTAARDPRVLVITLADRLHDLRTSTFPPGPEQERKARETLDFLAPLAHRLGLDTLHAELADAAFGMLFPAEFEDINRLLDEHAPQRDVVLRQVTQQVADDLRDATIDARVSGRLKPVYSIRRKMTSRSRQFAEIYDLVGVRILVGIVRECYAAHDVIRARWQPVPGRFKDYIATPKLNMYQSLHTTVIGPNGTPVEIQIRTSAMHRAAEYGTASAGRQPLGWQRESAS